MDSSFFSSKWIRDLNTPYYGEEMNNMTKTVYIVVWGDFRNGIRHISNDRFTQYVFDSLEKAQTYVRKCLERSAEDLGDDEAHIPDISDISVDVTYDCFNKSLGYDYIRIRQYYLM